MIADELGAAPRAGLLAPLWELLFPSRCLGCRRRGVVACADCRADIAWLGAAVCPACSAPTPQGRWCRRCARRTAPGLETARAACRYDGIIRIAIHELKFRQARYLAPFLARVLVESLAKRPLEADLLIPVPLSPDRLRRRGYNQAELVGAELARRTTLPSPARGVLRRERDTRPQVGLSAAEREANVRGAFSCQEPDRVMNQRIVLLDDVMTTGATLRACAEPLVQAGAARVMALVVARDVLTN